MAACWLCVHGCDCSPHPVRPSQPTPAPRWLVGPSVIAGQWVLQTVAFETGFGPRRAAFLLGPSQQTSVCARPAGSQTQTFSTHQSPGRPCQAVPCGLVCGRFPLRWVPRGCVLGCRLVFMRNCQTVFQRPARSCPPAPPLHRTAHALSGFSLLWRFWWVRGHTSGGGLDSSWPGRPRAHSPRGQPLGLLTSPARLLIGVEFVVVFCELFMSWRPDLGGCLVGYFSQSGACF